jgi:hypothetical protein
LSYDPSASRRNLYCHQYSRRIHKDQSNLIPLDPEAFIQTALTLLASDRYLEKGMALMALTGRRPAEIFFSASFSLPKKKFPFPALIFSGFPSPDAVNTTTSPQLPKLSTSPTPSTLWTNPGNQATCEAPTPLSAATALKPKNMTEDIFIAEILGHKLLPGATALSVGQSCKDFYVVWA